MWLSRVQRRQAPNPAKAVRPCGEDMLCSAACQGLSVWSASEGCLQLPISFQAKVVVHYISWRTALESRAVAFPVRCCSCCSAQVVQADLTASVTVPSPPLVEIARQQCAASTSRRQCALGRLLHRWLPSALPVRLNGDQRSVAALAGGGFGGMVPGRRYGGACRPGGGRGWAGGCHRPVHVGRAGKRGTLLKGRSIASCVDHGFSGAGRLGLCVSLRPRPEWRRVAPSEALPAAPRVRPCRSGCPCTRQRSHPEAPRGPLARFLLLRLPPPAHPRAGRPADGADAALLPRGALHEGRL